jgi:hypothetical protein
MSIFNESISMLSRINFFNEKNIHDFVCSRGSSYVLIGFKKNIFLIFFNFLYFFKMMEMFTLLVIMEVEI